MKPFIPFAMCMLFASGASVLGGDDAQIRFLAKSVPDDLGEVIWVAGGKESDSVKLPVNQLSESITVPDRVFGLLSKEGKRKLAVITLPAVGDSFVILLFPEPEGTLKPVIIDVDPESFRSGDVFLYNHAEKTIAGHLGSTDFELPPGEGRTLRPGFDKTKHTYGVVFNIRDEAGDRMLRSMLWPVQTRNRSYCIFFSDDTNDRIEFRAVDEFVVPVK